MAEHVQVQKREYASRLGDPNDDTPYVEDINYNEDHVDVRGIFIQGDSGQDEVVHLTRDSAGRATFQDSENTTPLTLAQLATGGSGLTPDGHKILRQLIHFIDDGPAEGFTSGAYKETLPAANPFPTSVTWWESSSKTKKIVERLITWTGVNPTTDQWKVYDTDGTTVLWIVTDTISYTGPFETSRTRAIAAGP